MTPNIPYGRHDVDEADRAAVMAVLQSDWLTQGPAVPQLEQSLTSLSGAAHAVVVNSATSALHIACLALGLKAGDTLWTSPTTFVASANAARYCGADVDFVDIDPRTYNISVSELQAKLEKAERTGRLPKIVIPVHLCGQSCDMAGIQALAQRYGFKMIEDASHALGGQYRGVPVGSCKYSDVTVFSFHPVKIITSGEGGAALTNSAELAERMRLLRSHGITNDKARFHPHPAGEIWNYEQVDLGFNYRMTDIHAALGLSQMGRIAAFVARRREVAAQYDKALAALPLVRPWQSPETASSYHLYPVRIPRGRAGKDQGSVYRMLQQERIGANLHYIPVYRQPYYQRLGFKEGYCPEAEAYFLEAITLPLFPSIDDASLLHVVAVLKKALAS